MVCLISDIHGGECMRGLERALKICKESDLLIVLGDLGIKFDSSEATAKFTEYFMSLKIGIAFIDGNHENHPYVNSFPTEVWNGGKVHRLTDNIVHLMRGNIYTFEGKTFFTMGGCKSSAKWAEAGLLYDGEDPSEAETAHGRDSLVANGNRVDYILTHMYSPKEHRPMGTYGENSLYALMDYIDENVDFRHWYAGHWHISRSVDEKHTYVYDEPIILK